MNSSETSNLPESSIEKSVANGNTIARDFNSVRGNHDPNTESKIQHDKSQSAQNFQAIERPALEPIRFRFPEEPRGIHMRNALLPYLAAGFHVVPTPVRGYRCGFYALSESLHAARLLAQAPGEGIEKVTAMQLEYWITSTPQHPSWVYACNEWFDRASLAFGSEHASELIEIYQDGTLLDINALGILLDAVNHFLGTNYSLAYVSDGYRGRMYYQQLDPNYAQHTTPQVASCIDESADPRPMIWIRNDNAQSISILRDAKSNIISHWCAFAVKTELTGASAHRAVSLAWNLHTAAREDGEAGVWVVHTPCLGTPEGVLRLYKGLFVRQITVPEGMVVPKGHMFMMTPDESQRGFVPITNLTRIEVVEPTDSRRPSVATSVNSAATEYMEALIDPEVLPAEPKSTVQEPELTMDQPKTVMKRPKMAKKQPRMTAKPKLTLQGPLDFEIFRTIPATNKIGELYEHDRKKIVDGFFYGDGDFLLQHVDYPDNSTMINIIGEAGYAKFRTLQHLRDAWGLPAVLPGPPARMTMSNTVVQLKEGAQARGLPLNGLKKDILNRIERFDKTKGLDSFSSQLPMYRVLNDIPSFAGPPKMPPFLATEVVLRFDDGDKDDARAFVKDYEGQTGRIALEDLEMLDAAWGITVGSGELRVILDGMHGKGKKRKRDNEDRNCEAEKVATVAKKVAAKKKRKRRNMHW